MRLIRMVVRPVMHTLIVTRNRLFSPKLLLLTNTGLCLSLSVAGDIMQQYYQARSRNRLVVWDKERTMKMGITGVMMGPCVHYWYIFLDYWLPGRSFSILCRKVLLDQLVCSPFYIGLFIVSLSYLDDKNWSEAVNLFQDKGPVLYVAEWVVWPPAQFINFFFLPTRFRVLYDNIVSLGFDCFWSFVWFEMEEDHIEDQVKLSLAYFKRAVSKLYK